MNIKFALSNKILIILCFLITSGIFARAEEILPPPSSARLTPTVVAVKKALPWVVNIGTNEKIIQINDPFNLFFTEFFNRQRQITTTTQYSPLGSGVIVDSRGLVLTNSHVVRRAQELEVRLWDGSSYPARVVGYDIPNDLCLLQLGGDFDSAKSDIHAAEFARANDLLLGETVLAIGNPFGLEHSVSEGVLSAFNRSFEEGGVSFTDIIQTDAAINPGNSGGPLLNLDGDLIGINLAIRSDAQGIGFAVPLARIELFLSYWMKPSHFSDAYLGLPPDAAVNKSPDGTGVILPEVLPDSPLAAAGFSAGDTICKINGTPVRRQIDLARAIWALQAGDEIVVEDGAGAAHQCTLAQMPPELLVETRLGLKLQELTPPVRRAMSVPEELEGLMVSEVISEPFFGMQEAQWRQVIKRGDVIVQFNNHAVASLEQLTSLLAGSRSGDLKQLGLYSVGRNRHNYLPLVVNPLQLN